MRRSSRNTLVAVSLLALMLTISYAIACLVDDATLDPRDPIRIPEHGRLVLPRESIPRSGMVRLVLELDDASRGDGRHRVRIVSGDGRRLDAVSAPLPAELAGVGLEIDAGFLAPGPYMIEIASADRHPLNLRRFVLELH